MDNDEIKVIDIGDIGAGYRNIAYRVNRDTHNGEIILYGYDKKGHPKTYKFEHHSHVKYIVPYKTREKSIFGEYVATKDFRNVYDRNKWMKSLTGSIKIIECYQPEQEFTQIHFSKYIDDSEFNSQKLRYHYLDIEIAIEDEFPLPRQAAYPINLITIYDTQHERYYTWALPSANNKLENTLSDKHDILLFQFDNEVELLKNFIDWITRNYPDVIVGWNTRMFDLPYIIRRIENVLDGEEAKKMSPVRDYYIKDNNDNPNDIMVYLKGVSQMDLMVLYRDKFMHKIDGGYKLDNVCEVELGENKLHYTGTMKEFYKNDFQHWFEYNVRDVELLVKLEEKLNLIKLSRTITSSGLCQMDSIYTSIGYILGSLAAHSRNTSSGVFPSYKARDEDTNAVKFEGAYVFPTQMGFYDKGVIGIDLKSLYPNTMIALNCSPETKVGKLSYIDDETYDLYRPNGKVKRITTKQLDTLTSKKCTLSKNATLFYKHDEKMGVVTSWLKNAYNERVKMKKLSYKYEKMYKREDDPELKLEYKNMSDRYDNAQYAQKIKLNSVYGVFGTPFSPIYDADIAQSVTLTGQFINRGVNAMIEDKFGKGNTIAGDTDSQYINIENITDEYCEKFGKSSLKEFTRTDIKTMLVEIDKFVAEDVNDFAKNMVDTECFTTEGYNIQYEREVLASESIFFKKKHYLMHLIDVGGKQKDKFKYMGIAVKKGELPAGIKTFLKDIYENTCNNSWGYAEYVDYLNEVYEKFINFGYDDISIWKGYRTAKESTGFLSTEKGTGAQVRGLHYHNDLLGDLNIRDKYTEIRLGDFIRYCYINKSNEYGIDVISFIDGSMPKEFEELFTIDYIKMFTKLVIKPLEGYVEAMGFIQYNPTNQMVEDVFSF
jgi:DNA polymerase elongation subunit (family B)